jgi:hypothetical protein
MMWKKYGTAGHAIDENAGPLSLQTLLRSKKERARYDEKCILVFAYSAIILVRF